MGGGDISARSVDCLARRLTVVVFHPPSICLRLPLSYFREVFTGEFIGSLAACSPVPEGATVRTQRTARPHSYSQPELNSSGFALRMYATRHQVKPLPIA